MPKLTLGLTLDHSEWHLQCIHARDRVSMPSSRV